MPMREERDLIYGDSEAGQADKRNAEILDSVFLGLPGIGSRNARDAATRVLRGVDTPNYDLDENFVAPDYTGDFQAQRYAMPEDAQATLAQESPEGRAAMLAALNQMGEMQNQAIGSQSDLDRQRASVDAGQFANAREGLIRQDAMRRGQVGGAADMIMRAQAAQMGANRNQEAGLQSAQQAALQRLAGNQAQAGLAGDIRRGDQAMGFANADIINRFNMANTAARNATRSANTDVANRAGLRNLDARQQANNQRADASNRSLSRRDDLMGQGFSQGMQRAGGIANALTGQAVGAEGTSRGQQDAMRDFLKMFGAGFSSSGGGK